MFASRVLLFVLLGLLAVGAFGVNTMIFIDNTNYFTATLPGNNPNGGSVADPVTYVNNGTMTFSVDWNGDAADTASFSLQPNLAVGGNISVFAFGPNAAACNSGNVSTSGNTYSVTVFVHLTANVTICNFTVVYNNWRGQLTVDYANGTTSENVNVYFTTVRGIVGDPQFIGLRGQSYQVHGIDGAVYNLITEQNTQVNSRFVFLTSGECPVVNGVRASSGCWSHPGSYMGDMSFQTVVDGQLHAAMVTAGSAKKGFSAVQMDGKPLALGETVAYGAFSMSYNSTHGVTVTLDNYNVELSNSDMFLNLALTAKVPLSQLQSHGLIGQTHSTKTHKTAIRYVEGDIDDYLVTDDDLFGTDFPFNQFAKKQ